MMLAAEGPSALPLWINGHAFLTMPEHFQLVTSPSTGQTLRQVPLCGEYEVNLASTAAINALADWQTTTAEKRFSLLNATADLLSKYAGHFAKLITEESGIELSSAENEVNLAIAALKQPATKEGQTHSTVTILADASQPFAAPIQAVAQALNNGNSIVLKTSVKAPSPLFAFAELTARAELPAGVFNLIHGDEAAIEAIAANLNLTDIRFTGEDVLAGKIQARLNPHHKTLVRLS